jgi:hypothetical protein
MAYQKTKGTLVYFQNMVLKAFQKTWMRSSKKRSTIDKTLEMGNGEDKMTFG